MSADGPVRDVEALRYPRLDRPSATKSATCRSCSLKLVHDSGCRRRVSRAARSSWRARSAQGEAPSATKVSSAVRSGMRDSVNLRRRRSQAPYSRSRRAR